MRIFPRPCGLILIAALLLLAAAASAGTIAITVHPGGGTVCLDTVCTANPAASDGVGTVSFVNMESGRYHMLNVYGTAGYEPYLGQVYLEPGAAFLARDVFLKPLPSTGGTGTVRVFVTPDGGSVCLDKMCEVSSGDGTGSWSVQFTGVTANTYHTLTILAEGHTTTSLQVRVLPGETKTLDISLKPGTAGATPAVVPTAIPPEVPAPATTRASLPALAVLTAIGIGAFTWGMKRS